MRYSILIICIIFIQLQTEEFGIYLSYVRRLGFEENPDYEFLRELFTKVLKNKNEVEDGIYDWMLLNGGKGWEASVVSGYLYVFRAIVRDSMMSFV